MSDDRLTPALDRLRRQHYYVSLAMIAFEPTADKLLYCDTHQRIVLTFDGRKPCCIAANEAALQQRVEAAERWAQTEKQLTNMVTAWAAGKASNARVDEASREAEEAMEQYAALARSTEEAKHD